VHRTSQAVTEGLNLDGGTVDTILSHDFAVDLNRHIAIGSSGLARCLGLGCGVFVLSGGVGVVFRFNRVGGVDVSSSGGGEGGENGGRGNGGGGR